VLAARAHLGHILCGSVLPHALPTPASISSTEYAVPVPRFTGTQPTFVCSSFFTAATCPHAKSTTWM